MNWWTESLPTGLRGRIVRTDFCWMATRARCRRRSTFRPWCGERGLPEPVVIHLDVPDEALVTRLTARSQCPKCKHIYNSILQPPRNRRRMRRGRHRADYARRRPRRGRAPPFARLRRADGTDSEVVRPLGGAQRGWNAPGRRGRSGRGARGSGGVLRDRREIARSRGLCPASRDRRTPATCRRAAFRSGGIQLRRRFAPARQDSRGYGRMGGWAQRSDLRKIPEGS